MLNVGVLILKWPKSQTLHIPYPYFMGLKCFSGWVLPFPTIQWFVTLPVLELPLQMDANLSLTSYKVCSYKRKKVYQKLLVVFFCTQMFDLCWWLSWVSIFIISQRFSDETIPSYIHRLVGSECMWSLMWSNRKQVNVLLFSLRYTFFIQATWERP